LPENALLRAVQVQVLEMSEIRRAHELFASGRTVGKIVLHASG
ncbi:MAG: zinc-binding dehydrogenase, partial [Planctomycetaceae bacterium]|nr:zinc-binding dehydrogenase [Planctomycetaceae bacterium]